MGRLVESRRAQSGAGAWALTLVLLVGSGGLSWAEAGEAEVRQPEAAATTRIVLATTGTPSFEVEMRPDPPELVLQFHAPAVVSRMPVRLPVNRGVVTAIRSTYASPVGAGPRPLRALHIELAAPVPYRVLENAGQILIEFEHPAGVTPTAADVQAAPAAWPGEHTARQRAVEEAQARLGPGDAAWMAPAAAPAAVRIGTAAASAGAVARDLVTLWLPRPHEWSAWWRRAEWWAGWLFLGVGSLLMGVGLGVLTPARGRATGRVRMDRLLALAGREPLVGLLIERLFIRSFEAKGYGLLARPSGGAPVPWTLLAKGVEKILIQWQGTPGALGQSVVAAFHDEMLHQQAQFGYLATAGTVTPEAEAWARGKALMLLDGAQVVECIEEGRPEELLAAELSLRTALAEQRDESARLASEVEWLRVQLTEGQHRLAELEATMHRGALALQEVEAKADRERQTACEAEARAATAEERARDPWVRVEAEWRATVEARDAELRALHAELEQVRRAWQDNEWYLGEARATVDRLSAEVLAHRAGLDERNRRACEVEARLREDCDATLRQVREELAERSRQMQVQQQRLADALRRGDDANWYLGEERAVRARLEDALKAVELRAATERERAHVFEGRLRIVEQDAASQGSAPRAAPSSAEPTGSELLTERRRFPRLDLARVRGDRLTWFYIPEGAPPVEVAVKNVSAGGACLEVPSEPAWPDAVRLECRGMGLDALVTAQGRVAWQRPRGRSGRVRYGVTFTEVDAAGRRALGRYVEERLVG